MKNGVVCIDATEMLTILIVDDDTVDRMTIVRQLRAANILSEVLEAADSAQGEKLVCSGANLDCILVDYRLPDSDGVEFIKFLAGKGIDTPVIVLTGQGDEAVAVESMKAGAVDYLVKGSRPEKLVQAIYSAIRLHKAQLEAKQATEKAVQAEKMAFLGTMIAGMAHEINQPLNAIKLSAGIALYRHRKGETLGVEEIMGALATIHSRCEQIEQIINNVRMFVRSEYIPVSEPCDINAVVYDVLDMFQDRLSESGITITKALAADLPQVLGEKQRLTEIVANIVVNAIHALEESEQTQKNITIMTVVVSYIRIIIEDNGPGVDPSITGSLFEPFVSTKSSGKGMGLGLSIAQTAVMALGGTITCSKNDSGGATFTVSLPPCTSG